MESSILYRKQENNSMDDSSSSIAGNCAISILGIWEDGKYFDVSKDRIKTIISHYSLEIQTSQFGLEDRLMNFKIFNSSSMAKHIKLILSFNGNNHKNSTAFFSPQEGSVIQFCDGKISYFSGFLNRKGLMQYCILDYERLERESFFKSMEKGEILFSPLARGKISGVFTLEAEIKANETIEGTAWAIHSYEKEKVSLLNETLRKNVLAFCDEK